MAGHQIRAVKNGDGCVAEEIVRENYDAIYKYCYWKIRNSEDAQDITQEVFLRFVKNIDSYSEQGKPKAFLYTIAKNLCINWYKKYKPQALDEEQQIIDFNMSNMLDNVTNKLVLQNIIRELSKEQQEVILLRFGQALKLKEIAMITDTSRFTVQYRIKTALAALKRKLR